MQMFTVCTLALWAVLRGRPHAFKPIAWVYEIICLMEYTSSLWLVPADELRLMWFFVNIPGMFILLGVRAGWFITRLSAVWLMVSNTLMPVPYSVNAKPTCTRPRCVATCGTPSFPPPPGIALDGFIPYARFLDEIDTSA
jgi:hypothetical protein